MAELPSGTVTLLFTDIEGSTRLLQELGDGAVCRALAGTAGVIREAFGAHGGVEVDTQGDAFFCAFASRPGCGRRRAGRRRPSRPGPSRCAWACTPGTPHHRRGYVGDDVHLGARVAAAAHGGQVVLSRRPATSRGRHLRRDLGEHRMKDFAEPVWIYQLGDGVFPPLRTISNTNLPRPASSFVGREREAAEVARCCGAVAPRDPDRAGRLREDAAVDRGGLGARRRVQERRLLGRPARPQRKRRGPGRSRRRSGRRAISPGTSVSGRCCSCSTTSSRWSTRRRELAALARGLSEPEPAGHLARAPPRPRRGRVRGAAARRAGRGRALLPARGGRAERGSRGALPAPRRPCRSRSSSPPPARRRSRRSRSSSGSASGSTCSRAAATPSERQGTLRATIEWSSRPALARRAVAVRPPRACSSAAARSRRRRRSARPTSTRSSRSSRRASSAIPATASGCWRRSGSTRSNGSESRTTAAIRRRLADALRRHGRVGQPLGGERRGRSSRTARPTRAGQFPRGDRLGARP